VAFLIVGWVGVKLAVLTLAHKEVGIIPESFAHSATWSTIFYGVLVVIALGGWFLSKNEKETESNLDRVEHIKG
jgi:predicted tellurium resistance membrane protein TerC